MNFQLKTAKEILNLNFNAYFIGRVCELSGKELSDVFTYLIGKGITDDNVSGGFIQSMDVRANVIAAGIDAYNHKNGNSTTTTTDQGYVYLDDLSLIDPQFAEMYKNLVRALVPNAVAGVKKSPAKVVKKPHLKK